MTTQLNTYMDKEDREIVESLIKDYDEARLKLSIRLKSKESVTSLVRPSSPELYTLEGDQFIAFYQLLLRKPNAKSDDEMMTVHLTYGILDYWGINMSTLKHDALNGELAKPYLFSLGELMSELAMASCGEKYTAKNLLDGWGNVSSNHASSTPADEVYVLTNKERYNGASLILSPRTLERVASFIQDSYYVLPSSIHEVLIVPLAHSPSVEELEEMVVSVNETVVDDHEFLSDNVLFYDADIRHLYDISDYTRMKKANYFRSGEDE